MEAAAKKPFWRNPLWLLGPVVLAVVLYFFPPEQHRFYPRCVFHATTGLQCPGCGGLRATHQLLHGHLAAAFHYNPMFIISLPFALFWGVAWLVRRRTGRDWVRPFRHQGWLWLLLALVVAFAVVRNLPCEPFTRFRI